MDNATKSQCELSFENDEKEPCMPHNPLTANGALTTADFSHIVRGCVYGRNSREIYEKFCDALGWDRNKASKFGWRKPLYACNADTDRANDVWFIYNPNYDVKKLAAFVDDFHIVNLIQNDGDTIIEVADDYIGRSTDANRITFVKTNKGYEFLGIYKIIKNGILRIYRRIYDCYPVKE